MAIIREAADKKIARIPSGTFDTGLLGFIRQPKSDKVHEIAC